MIDKKKSNMINSESKNTSLNTDNTNNHFLRKFSPEYLTIEYYKDEKELIRILKKCRQLYTKAGKVIRGE